MKNWHLRKARPDDATALAVCFELAYSIYAKQINDLPAVSEGVADDIANNLVWVAESDGGIVGGVVLVLQANYAILANVAVTPFASGTGLGKALVEQAEYTCRELKIPNIRLSTHAKMPKNVSLYEYLGWHVTNREGNKVHMEKTVVSHDNLT